MFIGFRLVGTFALGWVALMVTLPMAMLLGNVLHSVGLTIGPRPLSTGLLILVSTALALRRRRVVALAVLAGPLLLLTPFGWAFGSRAATDLLLLLGLTS